MLSLAVDVAAELNDARDLDLSFERARLKSSLHAYLLAAWPHIEPSTTFVDTWHVRRLCAVLQEITEWSETGHLGPILFKLAKEQKTEKHLARWIFNIPPGTLKSILISVIWPSWVWARKADKRFLTAAYGAHLTTRDNLRVRDIIRSRWFQELFPLRLVDDQDTKTRFNTLDGGWRIATSVGGVGTGEHPDVIIIDDPTTAAQAASKPERETANGWFDNTVSSRGITRKVVIIVVMQRLHVDDMTGHLLSKGGWNIVRFPMRYEKCGCQGGDPKPLDEHLRCVYHRADINWRPDPLDERTTDGELLCPELVDEDKVRTLELDLGSDAPGQLQQRPSAAAGTQFKREWFKFADKAPTFMRAARGWDTAATEGDGDYTVGVKIGEEFESVVQDAKRITRSTGRFYVCDVVRDQLGPSGVDLLIRSTAQLDGKDVAQREEKEGGSAGKTVIEARTKALKGFNYKGVTISGSKATRAKPFRAQVEGGNVYLVRGPWNEPYLQELSNFPTWKNDDQVDGSSTAFNAVLLEEPPTRQKCTWGD